MLKILGISGSRVKNGNTYKMPPRNKIGGAMALAFFRGDGIETTLASLNLFYYAQQMIVANSGMYQLGAGAYTSRDGKGRFEKEPRHIVLEDEIGILSALSLDGTPCASNILLKKIKPNDELKLKIGYFSPEEINAEGHDTDIVNDIQNEIADTRGVLTARNMG